MSSRPRRSPDGERASSTRTEGSPHDIGVVLTLALDAFKQRLHAHLADAGYDDLGPSFGFVFRSLADGPLSLVALADRLGLTSQGALKIAAEMERRGSIERQNDVEDRRVRHLVLSSRGRAALREARRFHASVERELARTHGAAHVAAARLVLESLAGALTRDVTTWAGSARPF